MTEQPVCSADDCETIIPDDRVELVEVPIEGTGEWIETGEHDEEFGLEITDGTGDWQPINVGDCVECQHQQEALLAKLEARIGAKRTEEPMTTNRADRRSH